MTVQLKLGRWMGVAAWVLLLILLTMLFSRWFEHQYNPNRHLRVTTDSQSDEAVVLKQNRKGHYLAPGKINDIEVVFLLDTGATYVAVSQELAEQAGLREGMPHITRTASGRVMSRETEIEQVQLGHITMHRVQAAIVPGMPDREVLLGMSFLKHLKLEQLGDELVISMPKD
jgi:aspartyl protease family protein